MANRRKTIVINKPFQYQQALLSVALAVLLLNLLLIVQMLTASAPDQMLDSSFIYSIGVIELLLMGAVWWGSLRSSHRIAGPVYVFTREINKLGDGDFTARIKLRKKDMFVEQAEEMHASVGKLRAQIATLQGLSARSQAAGAGSPEQQQALGEMCSIIDGFKTGDKTT